jgi:hypothetical protein
MREGASSRIIACRLDANRMRFLISLSPRIFQSIEAQDGNRMPKINLEPVFAGPVVNRSLICRPPDVVQVRLVRSVAVFATPHSVGLLRNR